MKKYEFMGSTDEQVRWGSNDDPRKYMQIGAVVTLIKKEVYSWHTKLQFKEFPDKKFNSVCFKEK